MHLRAFEMGCPSAEAKAFSGGTVSGGIGTEMSSAPKASPTPD